MRVSAGGPRRVPAALLGSVLVCALLMGATCWRWSGAQSRLLSLQQAVDSAREGRPDAVHGVYLRLCEAHRELAQLAEREDDVGARARVLLDLAQRKMR